MVGGIRFEHTHRLVAATVGFLTLILTIWIGRTEPRKEIRWLAIAALGAVVLQGILGGLTVLFRLPAPISVTHACLGPIFFCVVVTLATIHSPQWEASRNLFSSEEAAKKIRSLSLLTNAAIFLQLLFGAIVRHTSHGMGLHVASAFLVLVLTSLLISQAWHFKLALFLGILVIAEFFLGIGTFIFTRVSGIPHNPASIFFPTVHQTMGALILATSIAASLDSFRRNVALNPAAA